MPRVKRIVCLANSRKLSGRCVAGKELSLGGKSTGWIRPISDREDAEISEHERQYEDGSDPRVLDIIDVPLLAEQARGYQQENWLIDPQEYWVKVGRAAWSDLQRLADPVGPLWINGHRTYNGLNDKIPVSLAGALTSSLRFVHVDRVRIVVFKPGEAFGNSKRRVQARFEHEGTEYRLWVTDPFYERVYLKKDDGDYEIGESFLTVSTSEPYKQECYKLIAAIIENEDGTRT